MRSKGVQFAPADLPADDPRSSARVDDRREAMIGPVHVTRGPAANLPETTATNNDSSSRGGTGRDDLGELARVVTAAAAAQQLEVPPLAGSRVPPPTVPTVSEGRVMRKSSPSPPSGEAWLKATAFSATQAVSCPVAR